ncbi:MAG: MFS transporter [Anaerolineae bacterium]|nr:MFS transporter [Anaerolineae bacterium]
MTTTITNIPRLTAGQRQIIGLGWLTYAAYYLGRVNISTAMPDLQADLGWSASQVGLLTSGFFWTYAFGNLINGQLGDRFSVRWFVFTGIVGSVLINLMVGTLSSLPLIILLWSINGYFQATGWAPILRLLANWLSPEQRNKISGGFGSSFVAGNALTWLLSGWVVETWGWRAAFWLPALLFMLIGLLWFVSVRDVPGSHEPSFEPAPARSAPALASVFQAMRLNFQRFWPLLMVAAAIGFGFVALLIWIPTYYVEVGRLEIGRASSIASLLPFVGIGGTLFVGWLVGRYMVGRETTALTLIISLVLILLVIYPLLPFSLIPSTVLLLLISGIVYAAASVTLTTMSLVFSNRENAASLAGTVGFAFNVGGGISGWAVGSLLDGFGWSAVFWGLAGAMLLGLVSILLARRFLK